MSNRPAVAPKPKSLDVSSSRLLVDDKRRLPERPVRSGGSSGSKNYADDEISWRLQKMGLLINMYSRSKNISQQQLSSKVLKPLAQLKCIYFLLWYLPVFDDTS
ncbi:unnamed protein product [Gongylonema pulchrum]|uniref:Uncharacterized protein n=1 Tax=Gongylonema pulchrum TaxID=637853 RepID=A0A183DD56_9BILA|nr:unnamed protein product [Gongylonema pulchrum]